MAAGHYELKIDEAASLDVLFTWRAGGLPVNLTGYQFRAAVFNDKGVQVLAVSATPTAAGSFVAVEGAPTSGQFRLHLDDDDTKFSTWRRGRWVLEARAPGSSAWERKLAGPAPVSARGVE
jgi:hypothetical protein